VSGAAIDPGGVRLRLLGGLFAVAFLAIVVRLAELCLLTDGGGGGAVLRPHPSAGTAAASRADIVDRNGALLATSLYTVSAIADPQQVHDPEEAAAQLARVLPGTDRETLLRRLKSPRRYALLKRHITPEEQQAVNDLGLPGIGFEPVERRVYPVRNLAAHVVGAVNAANRGTLGVEHFFDQPLREEIGAGKALVLSLDVRVQQILRAELETAIDRFKAEGGNGIVLDVRTGEVLAMVSLPDFDPNWSARTSPAQRFDRNVQGTYEVGSLFKVFTVAAGLETGAVSLYDGFDTTEPLRIGRRRINDFHAHRRVLSLPEVFIFSSNIATARVAQAVGPDGMQAVLGRLGLLTRPEIELAGTAAPQPPPRWSEVYLTTVAYGHGIAVSPLQVADAVATVVRGGERVPVTLLRRVPGTIERRPALSPATSEQIRWLMWLNVAEGTGRGADVPGYLVGGKTGTAEKPRGGRYDTDALISSFVAAFPAHEPRYVVLVMLDEPHGDAATFFEATGGRTAAPVVRRLIERLGPLLGVAPVAPADELAYRARLRVGTAINGRTKREERSLEAVGPGV
jgi:cell division protein FtsI (penicillin-binding protein 3)